MKSFGCVPFVFLNVQQNGKVFLKKNFMQMSIDFDPLFEIVSSKTSESKTTWKKWKCTTLNIALFSTPFSSHAWNAEILLKRGKSNSWKLKTKLVFHLQRYFNLGLQKLAHGIPRSIEMQAVEYSSITYLQTYYRVRYIDSYFCECLFTLCTQFN